MVQKVHSACKSAHEKYQTNTRNAPKSAVEIDQKVMEFFCAKNAQREFKRLKNRHKK